MPLPPHPRLQSSATSDPDKGFRDYQNALDQWDREERAFERFKVGVTNFLAILAALLAYHYIAKWWL